MRPKRWCAWNVLAALTVAPLTLVATPASAQEASPRAAPPQEGITVGKDAPVVSIPDLDGQSVDLGKYIGKRPVLLEYWATWCTVCSDLMPRVRAAQKKYGRDVEFIGVNVGVNQSLDRVRRYRDAEKPPFRIVYDAKGISTRAYSASTTSYIVIIDRDGKVAYTGVGTEQDFEAALARVAKP